MHHLHAWNPAHRLVVSVKHAFTLRTASKSRISPNLTSHIPQAFWETKCGAKMRAAWWQVWRWSDLLQAGEV